MDKKVIKPFKKSNFTSYIKKFFIKEISFKMVNIIALGLEKILCHSHKTCFKFTPMSKHEAECKRMVLIFRIIKDHMVKILFGHGFLTTIRRN